MGSTAAVAPAPLPFTLAPDTSDPDSPVTLARETYCELMPG